MGVRTREDYIESLKRQKPVVYMNGDKVDNIIENKFFQVGINSIAVTYDLANDPKFSDAFTLYSSLINEKISIWTNIQENSDQALIKTKLMRTIGEVTLCPCHYRCLTTDCVNAAWAVSYEIDKKYGTNYHKNVTEIVKKIQREDLVIGGAIVDPKGDRRFSPIEQEDPDMYLHIVDKNDEGVIVRGAKSHSTAAPYTNLLCVFPSRPMSKKEKDYAIAFFTPVDADGIKFICKAPPMPEESKDIENPISSRFGHVETTIIFDDVFVPWENVFMCGENEFTVNMLRIFNSFHTWHKCCCRCASMELAIGALALSTYYAGTTEAPHIKSYLTKMIMNCEIVYACALAAAIEGFKHPSGVYVPNRIYGNTGKVFAAEVLGEERYYLQEASGGVVVTMPSEKDYRNPETGKYLKKYLKARKGTSVDERVKVIKLIEDLIASKWAGWYWGMCISGGATTQTLKERIFSDFDIEKAKEIAKKAAKIE